MSKIGRKTRIKNACALCGSAVPLEHKNVHVTDELFCSVECEMGAVVARNLLFTGSVSELIPHLRYAHGLSKEQIKIGVDRIFADGDHVFCGALLGWEDYY